MPAPIVRDLSRDGDGVLTASSSYSTSSSLSSASLSSGGFYSRPPAAPRGQRPGPAPYLSHMSIQQQQHPHHDSPSSFLHALYDTTHMHNYPTSQPFSPFAMQQQQQQGPWSHMNHMNMMHLPHTIATQAPPPLPPPQIAHKVWILDCKSCGTFLTNRGMKAVLLLRPNVSLFSTDALPINCSAYTANPETPRISPSRPSPHAPPRTCECLTQTLCCHGCGTAVGYMIVIPCSRCTSSITATNRATNGHRFVFHSTEIVGSERHYVPDEPGVLPYDVPPPLFCLPPLQPHLQQQPYPPPQLFIPPPPPLRIEDRNVDMDGEGSDPGSPPPLISADDYLPTPPVERSSSSPTEGFPFPFPPAAASLARGMTVDAKEAPPVQKLKAGEVLYWHHLMRNGEIPGVSEDARARKGVGKASVVACGR